MTINRMSEEAFNKCVEELGTDINELKHSLADMLERIEKLYPDIDDEPVEASAEKKWYKVQFWERRVLTHHLYASSREDAEAQMRDRVAHDDVDMSYADVVDSGYAVEENSK